MNNLCLGLLLVLHFFHSGSTQGCDPQCKGGQGTCQPSGHCLCWWGWTGPHATYITSGELKNRILADYCTTACHYTHDYRNPACARSPPMACSVPHNKTMPPIPCDPGCGTGIFHSTGKCLSNGRCLCWWGWTGPHACYISGTTFNNRILADKCNTPCHYTHVYRNLNCTNGGPTLPPSTKPHDSSGQPTTSTGSKASKSHSTQPHNNSGWPKSGSMASKPHSTQPHNNSGWPTSGSIASKPHSTQPHNNSEWPTSGSMASKPHSTQPHNNSGWPTSGSMASKSHSTQPHNNNGRPTTSSDSKASKPHFTSQQSSTNQQQLHKSVSTLAAISLPMSSQLHPTAKGMAQQHITSGKPIPTTDTKPSVAEPSTAPAVVNISNANPSTTETATGVQTKRCSTQKSTRTEKLTPLQTTAAIQSTTSAATATKTEPPEPTEPTEPVMAIRGMPQNVQSEQLQADDDGIDEKDSSANDSDSDPPKKNSTAAVILVVTLLVGLFAIVGVIWWKHGSGNQCSRLLGGYEPVENNDINAETNEFSLSSGFP